MLRVKQPKRRRSGEFREPHDHEFRNLVGAKDLPIVEAQDAPEADFETLPKASPQT